MHDPDLHRFDQAEEAEPTPSPARAELGGVSLGDKERRRAYVASVQRDLNLVRDRLGVSATLAIDGEWDEHTALAFGEVCRVLGIAPERTVRTFRLIAGAAASRTREERERAETDGAAYARELKQRYAQQHDTTAGVGGRALPPAERRRAYVAALQRDLNALGRRLGVAPGLVVDGEWDEHTDRAFRAVCRTLGIAPERTVRSFRLIAGAAASRTKEEKARAEKDGAAFAERLRAEAAGPAPQVVGGESLPRDERKRAYVAALQRDLNGHLARLGSPAVLAVDGRWDVHTDRAFRRVCRVLGVDAERNARTYRIVGGALAPLTAAERERAAKDGAAYEQKLRREFERQSTEAPARPPKPTRPTRPTSPPTPSGPTRPTPAGGDRLVAAIHRHGGRHGREIVREARRHGLPVSLLCTIAERESNFRMVFGRDSAPGHTNPIKSPPGSLLEVTGARYAEYLRHRRAGRGSQGVGIMQLTSAGLQDRADQLGGCWKPGPNIRVGAEYLAGNIKRLGARQGIRQYNGSGQAAERYADAVLAREKVWRARLGGASGSGAARPRTLRLTEPRMKGRDVLVFQRLLNRWFRKWHVRKRIGDDGEFGPRTRRAAREVAFGMGIARAEFERGFTPQLRGLMAHPTRRTPAQRERARNRTAFRRSLQRKNAAPAAIALLHGLRPPKSAYLRRVVQRAHAHGLVVTSTNDGRHARTSWHYQDLAVDFGVAAPLVGTSEHTRRLVAFQLDLLEDRTQILELFGPRATACVKNGARITIGGSLLADHRDHVHVAAR